MLYETLVVSPGCDPGIDLLGCRSRRGSRFHPSRDQAKESTHIELIDVHSSPLARFLYDVATGTEPLTVQFYDESARSPATYLWDFGDGTTSTEPNASHIFGAL